MDYSPPDPLMEARSGARRRKDRFPVWTHVAGSVMRRPSSFATIGCSRTKLESRRVNQITSARRTGRTRARLRKEAPTPINTTALRQNAQASKR